MDSRSFVADTERHLRLVSTVLTGPHEHECLLCYVWRMLDFGCTGLRWATHYRDLRAPRATALERRLGQKGGFCDCEIFLNGFELRPQHMVGGDEYVENGVSYIDNANYPDPMPPCRGVRRGSTQGCALWAPIRHGW